MTDSDRRHFLALAIVFVLGVAVRLAYVERPLDHRLISPWRQADYIQIARNFHRADMNVLYPRIDWQADTPGYVEAEFPFLPWIGASFFRVTGYREQTLRWISAFASIATLLAFLVLARASLPPIGSVFAATLFAFNPLLVNLATSMQPEAFMLLFSVVAVFLVDRWDKTETLATLLGAGLVTGLAILAKASAAYLGLLFAWLVWRKLGLAALRSLRIYAAAALACIPPLLWYAWTHQFWLRYGNSLGLTNESHFLGLDLLWPPVFLLGNFKWELLGVFTPPGLIIAGLALFAPRLWIRLPLIWYAAACVFYVASARTSADDWAFYYHSSSVAPACMLMGAGAAAIAHGYVTAWLPRGVAWNSSALAGLAMAGTLATTTVASVVLVRHRDAQPDLLAMRACALRFADRVSPEELIVTRGGPSVDASGRPVAYNESMIFAWMDRRGFNYPADKLSVEVLDGFVDRGASYWVARSADLKDRAFRETAAGRYHRVDECADEYSLYRLRSSAALARVAPS